MAAESASRAAGRWRVGDLVEVRSAKEILATLDEHGRLDGLPFMPEMLAQCGRRLRVAKSAHKTCDTIENSGGRRMRDAVHLEGVRCDGSAHGGCQASCFVFWKTAWLRPVEDREGRVVGRPLPASVEPRIDEDGLRAEARTGPDGTRDGTRFSCQTTELLRATTPLSRWNLGQYVEDVRSGNEPLREILLAPVFALLHRLIETGVGYRAWMFLYERLRALAERPPYPFLRGELPRGKTPRERLDLCPGDQVRVRPYREILSTLDGRNRNRGLRFGAEMVPYCGGVHRVRSRVERILDEKTGAMIELPNDCIVLEGVVCRSRSSAGRLFCPREIALYWREIWLERAAEGQDSPCADRSGAPGAGERP